jgi:23S rRNA (guanosine2251-2'-O)-methyltransferase
MIFDNQKRTNYHKRYTSSPNFYPPRDFKDNKPKPLRVVHDRKPAVDIIAGRNPVYEALKGGTLIEKIVVLVGVKGTTIEKIKGLAKKNRIPFVEVGKQKFRDLVNDTTTQGVVAIVGTKRYVEIPDVLKVAAANEEPPFVLILDEIEDPQNLGALIRTAECAGVHGAVIPKHHAATVNQTVAKTSAGASEHLAVAKVTNIVSTIDELKQKGVWVVGADAHGDKLYTEVDYKGPIALVIGNEGKGIRQLVKEKCDFVVKIPLYGKIGSLNASVAGALIMYEILKQRSEQFQKPPKPRIELPPPVVEATPPRPDDVTEEAEEDDMNFNR